MNLMDRLPLDVYYYLMSYLKPNDCMSLSLSGVSSRFTSFYAEKKHWVLRNSYSITPVRFKHFFTEKIVCATVKVIDLSHCYWLPAATIITSLIHFKKLEELYVKDTKLSLKGAAEVFRKCRLLKKLSIDVKEKSWQNYSQVSHLLQDGIENLTSIQLCFEGNSFEVWHLIFRILDWCNSCIELHLEVWYTTPSHEWQQYEEDIPSQETERLISKLDWMSFLQKFTYIKKGSHYYDHFCINELLNWYGLLISTNDCPMKQLWVQGGSKESFHLKSSQESSLTHLCLGHKTEFDPKLKMVTHLGGVHSFSSLPYLPNLKFMQGYCSSSEDLETFCQLHPQLEYLHFSCSDFFDSDFTFQHHDWRLSRLKSLVYACDRPDANAISKLTDVCPNLEELHVGNLYGNNILFSQEPVADNFHRFSTLKHLKTLTLSGFEFNTLNSEEFLKELFGNCIYLRSLHIAGQFEGDQGRFHQNLCKYIPTARNLRDFRFQREEISDSMLLEMLSAVQMCRNLERLVLHQDDWTPITDNLSSLPVVLVGTISKLEALIVLCITHPVADLVVETVREMLRTEVLPHRPAFWFHIGDDLPHAGNVDVPRVHLEEIIQPLPYFLAPPKSLHQY